MTKKKDPRGLKVSQLGTQVKQHNILDDIHETGAINKEESRIPKNQLKDQNPLKIKDGSRQPNGERKGKVISLYMDEKWNELLEEGRLEEKFKNKSVYLDHIFEQYFKDKPFYK